MNECITLIKAVYDVDVLDDSRISWFPQFRQKRESELTHLYESAYASLGGKQDKSKWRGFRRKDGKVAQLLPFRYGLELSEDGLCFRLENHWTKGLTDESHLRLFDFHFEFESLIHSLCYQTGVSPFLDFGDGCEPVSTFREHYEWMAARHIFNNEFNSVSANYPLESDAIYETVMNYAIFYPVYDSYIQIAKGEDVRFAGLIKRLNEWLRSLDESEEDKQNQSIKISFDALSETDLLKAKEAAEQRVKIMPAMRWRVFQRDDWKCVACGRNSQDGIILHIDHITPRSKGGKNSFENYQTLCNLCNIGKSNRDTTNLRIK